MGANLTAIWMQKQSAAMRRIFVYFYRPKPSKLMEKST